MLRSSSSSLMSLFKFLLLRASKKHFAGWKLSAVKSQLIVFDFLVRLNSSSSQIIYIFRFVIDHQDLRRENVQSSFTLSSNLFLFHRACNSVIRVDCRARRTIETCTANVHT